MGFFNIASSGLMAVAGINLAKKAGTNIHNDHIGEKDENHVSSGVSLSTNVVGLLVGVACVGLAVKNVCEEFVD